MKQCWSDGSWLGKIRTTGRVNLDTASLAGRAWITRVDLRGDSMENYRSIRSAGLISDTHGLLRDSVLEALEGVDLIIHAGDIGPPALLNRLKEIAPVVAVRGNVDGEQVGLPSSALISVNDRLIYILHDLNDLVKPSEAELAMIVSGHSHKPHIETKNGLLYVNPGSIGPRRFKLPVSFAKVTFDEKELTVQLIEMEN
jgi:uncharacterized protein